MLYARDPKSAWRFIEVINILVMCWGTAFSQWALRCWISLGVALGTKNVFAHLSPLLPLLPGCWIRFLFPIRAKDYDMWVLHLIKNSLLNSILSWCGATFFIFPYICPPSQHEFEIAPIGTGSWLPAAPFPASSETAPPRAGSFSLSSFLDFFSHHDPHGVTSASCAQARLQLMTASKLWFLSYSGYQKVLSV